MSADPLRVLVKSAFSPYSGYGQDGIGIALALLQAGVDVYLDPSHISAPLPPTIAALLTKRLVAPFDVLIHHADPMQLGITPEARRSAKVTVAWTMWEYSSVDNMRGRSTLRKRLRDFDLVLGYDEVTAAALAPHAPQPMGDLGVLQGGFWPQDWPFMAREWQRDRFGFCMVGQLSQRKDPFVAIQAFQALKQRLPEEFDGAELHLKAQPLDAKVLTPTGWVRMGDLDVGDVVCDAQGGIQTVEGVYPQGKQDIYEVEMAGGARTQCTLDHLWLSRTPNMQDYRVKTLAQILGEGVRHPNGLLRHRVPLTAPTRGAMKPCRHDSLDPYVLGLLLGDGGLTQNVVHFTSADEELVKAVTACVADFGCMLVKEPSLKYDYRVVRVEGRGRNGLLETMRSLGLMGLRSQEKRIPPDYLFLPTAGRLALLRGLMDTDGTVGTSVTFSTTSPALAEGVAGLVRSLGGLAACTTPYVGKYRGADGEQRDGSMVYPVRLTLHVCPFGLERKARLWEALWAKRRHNYENRIAAVRPAGRAPAQCIKVSGAAQTYITDDYIVTHNTNSLGLHPSMEQWIPKLRVHYSVWPDSVMREFYGAQHCLLAPSRGEGKNLPALEMLSTGGTVIATGWGGHQQWLSPAFAHRLNFTLHPVDADHPGCRNARASQEHLEELMLRVYRNRVESAEMGRRGSVLIPQMCAWPAVITRLFDRLAQRGVSVPPSVPKPVEVTRV